jgi:predicted  nucleic acid-binding Zn-ribbon protein|tara:strand:+ start:648 stop:860 length:213 start_codon:yes stop_codon:yes gene_type:complete
MAWYECNCKNIFEHERAKGIAACPKCGWRRTNDSWTIHDEKPMIPEIAKKPEVKKAAPAKKKSAAKKGKK